MDTGSDGNAGHLYLGLDASLSDGEGHAYGTIDYLHHIDSTPLGELTAFAQGFGGAKLVAGAWEPEVGITAGLGLEW